MNQIVQKFEVVEGGCLDPIEVGSKQLTKQPLNNSNFWLYSADLEQLAGVSQQAVSKALKSRRWRGADLMVHEEASNVGRGGKVLKVHVDSLPKDLRDAWYLARGIDPNGKVEPQVAGVASAFEGEIRQSKLFDKHMKLAQWRHDVIRPVLVLPKRSKERAAMLDELAGEMRRLPDGTRKSISRAQLYRWVGAFEKNNTGLAALMPKESARKGVRDIVVSRVWDGFFEGHISSGDHTRVGDDLTHYIRSLWGSGERGKYAVSEKATTRLIELSRDLGVLSFEALELGRPVSKSGVGTQFEVCFVNTRRVSEERKYQLLAIKRKDNATFQDEYVPHIRRDYSAYKPRDIIVGDVHPTDVMMLRPDGSKVYPKAISWIDIATNEMHMTFVLCEQGEGIKREHVAMAFEAMVQDWGLPKLLYLDNGSEYKWQEMIGGFTQLSKLTEGAFGIHDLDNNTEVHERVVNCREAVVRSLAYNAKGKPKIEGAFGNLEKVQFALLPGWTAGDRMSKKTHAKGKDPIPYPGDAKAFLKDVSTQLEWYHKRPQRGRLNDRSPNEALRDFIEGGWGKTVLSDKKVLELAFAQEVTRVPNSGRVSFKSRHGETTYYYHDKLLHYKDPITLKVPAYKPEYVFCFDGEELLCIARPEQTYGVLERAGAEELGRRKKYFHREVSEMAKHCALLDLVAETERHNTHMPDAPEAPVAVTVNADALERMAEAERQDREAMLANQSENQKPRGPVSQWKTGPNKVLSGFEFEEE